MMKRLIGLSIVFLGLVAICAPISLAADEQGTEPSETKIQTLESIQANPDSMKATVFTFRGQFHHFNEIYSPFYTPFNATTHLNFSTWEYDAPLWVKEVFKRDFPYLYVDKKNKALCEQLMQFKTFMRFEASGTVRSTFNGIPWIQITSIKELPKMLSRKSLTHMARGYHYLKKEKQLSVVLEFSQAYSEDLPYPVQTLIRKEEGKALFKIGSYEEAIEVLEEAEKLSKEAAPDQEIEFLLKEAIAMQAYEERMAEEAEEWEDEYIEEVYEEEYEEDAEIYEEEVEIEDPQVEEEKWIDSDNEVIKEVVEEEVVTEPEEEYIEEEVETDETLEDIDS